MRRFASLVVLSLATFLLSTPRYVSASPKDRAVLVIGSVDLAEIHGATRDVMELLRARARARWPDEVPRVALSQVSREILQGLGATVRVTYNVSRDLSDPISTLRVETRALFEAFRQATGGEFQYSVVDPAAEATKYARRSTSAYVAAVAEGKTPTEPVDPLGASAFFGRPSTSPEARRTQRRQQAQEGAAESGRAVGEVLRELLEAEFEQEFRLDLSKRGVDAFRIRAAGAGETGESRPVYSHALVESGENEAEVFSVLGYDTLEYTALAAIPRISRAARPRVVFFDGSEPETSPAAPSPPGAPPSPTSAPAGRFGAIENFLRGFTDLVATNSKDPKEFIDALEDENTTALIIAVGTAPIDASTMAAIRKAVDRGVAAIILTASRSFDMSPQGFARGLPIETLQPGPGFETWLADWGLRVDSAVLASSQCGQVVSPAPPGDRQGAQRIDFAAVLHAEVAKGAARSPLLASAGAICTPTASSLVLDPEKLKFAGIQAQVLAQSSTSTWSVEPTKAGDESTAAVATHARDLIAPKKGTGGPGEFIGPKPVVVLLRKAMED